MLSIEIEEKLKNIPNFLGVFSRDTLPDINHYPCALISNIDTHDLEGSHWIAIYIDKKGKGEYFDSFGLPPLFYEFLNFFERYTKGFFWNKIPLQCTTCVTCGQYCVTYILFRLSGISYKEYINLFSKSSITNDKIIKSIYNILK